MALPLTELETATKRHFMPVITNQIFKVSPVLHRIFKPAKAGKWGLALPSFRETIGGSKIYLDLGNPEIGNPSQAFGV